MSNLWTELIVENPMLAEVGRFRRRYLSTRGGPINTVVGLLFLLGYGLLTITVLYFRGDIPPSVIIVLQTVFFAFIGPAVMHGAIAGEREKRTWDVLVAAPVSKAQIIAGKFLGGALVLAAITLLMAVPILIATFGAMGSPFSSVTPGSVLLAEAISVSFGLAVLAMTLLFSARCRRAFTALGVSLAVLFGGLVVLPTFLGAAMGWASQLLLSFHPMVTIVTIETSPNADWLGPFQGLIQVGLYLFLVVVMLGWAERTMHFADGDTKFMARRSDA
jgi:ABC-type transport system involved in multi-copper enzyme maturation permease subunit